MKYPNLPWSGGCRCGKVRFLVTEPPLVTSVCHCRGCQRMTASAFSTTLTLAENAFAITEGATVIGGMHGEQSRHHHCDWCKSWLFTRLPPAFGAVNVRATQLDEAGWFAPFMETQTIDKLPWVTTPARRSFAGFPEPSAYPALLEEFKAF